MRDMIVGSLVAAAVVAVPVHTAISSYFASQPTVVAERPVVTPRYEERELAPGVRTVTLATTQYLMDNQGLTYGPGQHSIYVSDGKVFGKLGSQVTDLTDLVNDRR